MSEMLGWHFIRDNRRLSYDASSLTVAPGYSYFYEGKTPKLCMRGLHASEFALHALGLAKGDIICRVRLVGVVKRHHNKAVAWQRDVLAVADGARELRLYACWCVRQVWDLLTDKRSRRAVKIAEQYALGHATATELRVAREDARDAAAAGARMSSLERGTAWAAALTADWDTVGGVAGVVAGVARGTAAVSGWGDARRAQRVELERRMLALVRED